MWLQQRRARTNRKRVAARILSPRGSRSARAAAGTATVELAITLPALLALIFGTLTVCNIIYTKQSLKLAAYQGVRTAIAPHATNDMVLSTINELLNARQVQDFEVEIFPADISQAERGDAINISVGIKPDKAGNVASLLNGKKGLHVNTIMLKE